MLLGGGRPSEPSVIRNVEQELRPTGCKAAHFAGVDRFVANKDTEGIDARKLTHGVFVPFVGAANVAGHAGDNALDQWKMLVLTEGNGMDLVVDEDALALAIKE